uniref:C-type lectin domain-containing protein n=2 Tax=Caenorhabditis japonica TaxID=281687 RepID=A0A8R1ICS8_CAEJA
MRFLIGNILIALWISPIEAQLHHDESLRDLCKHHNGKLTPQTDKTGDVCEVEFEVTTDSSSEARDFCQLYAPWRQISWKHGKKTTCTVEATQTCKAGWVQMFGHCYLLPSKNLLMSQEEAVKECARSGAVIASLRHIYHVGVWKRVFPKISQVWIQVASNWEPYVFKETFGNALALAFSGKHFEFTVPSNSLVKVNKDWKLMALCEYKPPSTVAEVQYLGKKYSEIYWQGVNVPSGTAVRTSSHYTSSADLIKTCKNALKPFKVDNILPFNPNGEVDHVHPIRSPSRGFTGSFEKTDCVELPTRFYTVKFNDPTQADYNLEFVDDKYKEQQCDNMRSAAIVHQPNDHFVRVMADSASAPFWCQLRVVKKIEWDVPAGYSIFIRDNGEAWGYKFHHQETSHQSAQSICRNQGDKLSGFNSRKEIAFLKEIMKKNDALRIHIGATRSNVCNWYQKLYKDECWADSHWEYNVAQKRIEEEMWYSYKSGREDEHKYECLYLYKDGH